MTVNPTLKTMDDGSEFTVAHAGATLVLGAAIGTVLYVGSERWSNWRTNRWLKKHGHDPVY